MNTELQSLQRALEYGLQNGKRNMIVDLSALKELFDVHAKMDALERKVQLHESIHIYYHVDGYGARFETGDGAHNVAEGHGPTLLVALLDLESKVKDYERHAFYRALNTKGAETGRFKSVPMRVGELAKKLGWTENRLRAELGLPKEE